MKTRWSESDFVLPLRAGLAVASILLTALGLATSGLAAPTSEPTPQLHLFKPPHDDVRIEWSAAVHEEGGEFLVSRSTVQGPPFVVARVAPGRGRYRVVEPASAGAWVYQLRYRDRRGREHVLATVELNIDQIEAGRSSLPPAGQWWPSALPSHFIAGLTSAPVGRVVHSDELRVAALRGRPPTPPPRGPARGTSRPQLDTRQA